MGGNQQGSKRSSESGQVFPELPMIGQVFTLVRVGGGDEACVLQLSYKNTVKYPIREKIKKLFGI